MNRIPPKEIKIPEVHKVEDPDRETEVRIYKLITPLFGGGEKPQKPDSITVIRGAEVRGHLRFWWRATRGGLSKGKLEELKRLEDQVWGSSGEKGKAGPSKVIIEIVDWKEGKIIHKKEIHTNRGTQQVDIADPKSPWSYVAFPLRAEEGKPAGSVMEGIEFSVRLSYPIEQKEDVQAALWAWEAFGGIGARTRRGFGALFLSEVIRNNQKIASSLPDSANMKRSILEGLERYVVSGKWPDYVPYLRKDLKFRLVASKDKSLSAWEYLFQAMQKFRQESARYGSKFGLSLWPEANEIRRLFNRQPRYPEHRSDPNPTRKFPRAAFGIPIPFNMPHDPGLPKSLTLQGVKKPTGAFFDRLASPLILRPLKCSDGELGLAAILAWNHSYSTSEPYTPPGGLILKGAPKDPTVMSLLNEAEAKKIPPLKDEPDILIAFMNYLEKP